MRAKSIAGTLVIACGLFTAAGAFGADSVRLGAVYPLTGRFAVAGQDCKNGAQLAVDQINAAGGIKSMGGAKLDLVVGDSQSKPINAVGEAERLITQENVALVMGSATSSESIPMTQVTEKHGIPAIDTIAQSESITGRGFKWVVSSTIVDADYAGGLMRGLDIVRKLDPALKRVAVIRPDNDYGIQMGALLAEDFKKRKDVDLLGIVEYSSKAPDLTPAVLKVKAMKPQVLIQVGYFRDGVRLAKTYEQLDMHPILIGTGGASADPKLKTEIGNLVEGQIAVTPFSDDRPVVRPVAEAYKAKFHEPLTLNSALGYQGVLVAAAALEKAESAKPAAIRKALGEIKLQGKDVITASDFIAFDANGRNEGRNTVITQFQNGNLVTIGPESKATAKPILKAFNTK